MDDCCVVDTILCPRCQSSLVKIFCFAGVIGTFLQMSLYMNDFGLTPEKMTNVMVKKVSFDIAFASTLKDVTGIIGLEMLAMSGIICWHFDT